MHRRQFLTRSAVLGFAVTVPAWLSKAATNDRPPRLGDEVVEEFVRAAHVDLDRVREMLADQPGLINATWDWGGGDFETALGGASHMGEREIALYLLGQGARMDLFAATMLGRLEVVQAALAIDPALIDVPGPHGIPLIAHARAGGEPAAAVLAFLEGLTG